MVEMHGGGEVSSSQRKRYAVRNVVGMAVPTVHRYGSCGTCATLVTGVRLNAAMFSSVRGRDA